MSSDKLYEYFKKKFAAEDLNFLFDSHAHLYEFDKVEIEEIISFARKSGVDKIINVGIDLRTSEKVLENSRNFPQILYPTAGIHPELLIPGSNNFSALINEDSVLGLLASLREFIKKYHKEIIMVGECGLDYYWLNKSKLKSDQIEKSKRLQKLLFKGHLEIAHEFDLPLTIHTRDSLDDALSIVAEFDENLFGIFHSFTGNKTDLDYIFSANFAIGLNGIITYKGASDVLTTIKSHLGSQKLKNLGDYYKNNIYFETDTPYLIPAKASGKFNQPANLKYIVEKLNVI